MRYEFVLLVFLLWVLPGQSPAKGMRPANVDDPRFFQAFYVANACEAAYLPSHQSKALLKRMGITSSDFLEVRYRFSDTQVLIATHASHTVVCFRGTQEMRDYVNATMFSPSEIPPYTDSSVHTGFYDAWNGVQARFRRALNKAGVTKWAVGDEPRTNCHPLLIGGHSAGGALAVIAGISLAWEKYTLLGVYTFGQPPFLNGEQIRRDLADGAETGLLHIERFAFKTDRIATMPLFIYTHDGIGIDRYSRSIEMMLEKHRIRRHWLAGDHGIANYVRTLAAFAGEHAKSPEMLGLLAWFRKRDTDLGKYLDLKPGVDASRILIEFSRQAGMASSPRQMESPCVSADSR
jgi:hypothetical protein